MARRTLTRGNFSQRWALHSANVLRKRAPGVETTTRRDPCRARDITLENDPLSLQVRVGLGGGGEQRLGGCHINGEYCPVLVKEKTRFEGNQRLGLCRS
jgi:hypothetical protein